MASSIAKNGLKGQRRAPTGSAVSFPLVDLLHEAEAGLLCLSIQVRRRVLQELIEQEVTEVAGPKGRHNPQRAAVRHGMEEGYVFLGDRSVPVTYPRVAPRPAKKSRWPRIGSSKTPTWPPKPFSNECCLLGQPPTRPRQSGINRPSRHPWPEQKRRQPPFYTRNPAGAGYLFASVAGCRPWVVLMVDGIRVGGHLVGVALGIDGRLQAHFRIGRGCHREQCGDGQLAEGPG